MHRFVRLSACTLLACGARSLLDANPPVGQSSGQTDAGGPAGESTAADASAGGRPVCGDTVDPAIQAQSCANIGELSIARLQVVDAGPPRAGSPGQTALLEVELINSGSMVFQNPCVGLATDNPLVTVLPPNPNWSLFGVQPGRSATQTLLVGFDPSISVGAVVHVTAWLDALHAGCTNGATSSTTITVQP